MRQARSPRYRHYFLGSIVVSNKPEGRFIVDGQQRLTTLTLLLIYLHHLQGDRDDAEDVRELIFSKQHGVRSFNLNVPERVACMETLFDPKKFFNPIGASPAVLNLHARYANIEAHFPAEEFTGPASLPMFVDWLVRNVHLVEITAFSDEDAYTIFETMNDRGLSLTPTEMLKGYLLNHVTDKTKRDACNDTWKARVQELAALGKDTDADAFKSWLRSQHAVTIREGKANAEPGDFDRVGSEFHRWVRDSEEHLSLKSNADFATFIQRDFDFYARQYVALTHASRELQDGLEPIYYNAQAGFTLQPMLLLAPAAAGRYRGCRPAEVAAHGHLPGHPVGPACVELPNGVAVHDEGHRLRRGQGHPRPGPGSPRRRVAPGAGRSCRRGHVQ